MTKGGKVVQFPGWRRLLRTNANGNPYPDLANVMIALRNEPGFAVAFAFDEMQQQTIVRATPPLVPGTDAGDVFPRPADDDDISRLQEWLQTVMPKVGREQIYWALELFAHKNPIHPVRLMLRTREIGVRQPVLHNWLSSALGVPSDAYHNEVGRRFAIAMVARIMEPGCQCDYMMVLEGPQGKLKSQFCRALAGDQYFSDHIPAIGGDQVRTSMHLRGKWLIEISELAAFNKIADVETLKAFVTRRWEIYIPKYGRKGAASPAKACSSAQPTPTIGSRTKPAPAASGRSRSSTSTSNGWPSTATSFSPKRSKPTTLANRGGPTRISSAASWPPTKRSASSTTTGPIRRWSWQGR